MNVKTPTLQTNFSAILASFRVRLLNLSRYRGQLLVDIFIPTVFAAMPILLGRASAGANIGAVFKANTGTSNYVAYLLIGSSAFTIVSNAFWHIAYWLRWEQESGTLEALYLVPTSRIWVVTGTSLYSYVRSILSALIAYPVGCLILRINPLQGEVGLAMLFVLVGLIPVYGLSFLFGAVVMRVKQANTLVNLMQWGVSLLMGVFFPVSVFPPLMKLLALIFPPTWMVNGVRSAMLGVGFFFGKWYLDMAVLWVFMMIVPWLGYWVFARTENTIRKNEGMGAY